MRKPNLSKLGHTIVTTLDEHSPQIFMGFGIAGMITTTFLAVTATPKALLLIDEKKEELQKDKLTPVETVQATWKCYLPSVVTCVFSTGCLLTSNSITTRRTAALATAYKISETALLEYRDKVVETIGEKKEKEITDKIAKDHVEKNPVTRSEVIITEKGNTLCFDTISGRYFRSDIEKIKRIQNEMNRTIINDNYVSLNEFYDELGLDYIDVGSDLGWNVDALIDIDFSSQLADDGTPCLVIRHYNPPKYNYSRFGY